MRPARIVLPALVLLAVPAAAGVDLEKAAPKSFGDCDALASAHPLDREALRCFYVIGNRLGQREDAARRLEALLAVRPESAWPRHWLARIYLDQSVKRDEAEGLLERAIEEFASAGDATGEVWSRGYLGFSYRNRRRYAEAQAVLEKALDVARGSGEPELVVSALIELAWLGRDQEDLRSAWAHIKEAEAALPPDGSASNRARLLQALGAFSYDTRRYSDAWDYYRRQRELVKAGDPAWEAGILRNLALVAGKLVPEGRLSDDDFCRLRQESLDAAVRAGNRHAEVGARLLLASHLRGAEALEEVRRAVALARELEHPDLCWALWLLAQETAKLGPARYDEAFGHAEEAIALARSTGDRVRMCQGLVVRAAMRMVRGPRDRGIAETLEALDAIEKGRDVQLDRDARMRIFARHAHVYRRFASQLIGDPDAPPSRGDLGLAFSVLERLRARELLDSLDAARGTGEHTLGGPRTAERSRVLEEIAGVQRRLVAPSLATGERESLFLQLERLELREAGLREEIASGDPGFAALRRPSFATLADVQATLAPDQAMVVFVAGQEGKRDPNIGRFDLGFFALALTRASVERFALPRAEILSAETEVLLSLVERRDRSEREGLERLYRELMQEIVEALPPDVDRLVLVPDGVLNRLPFDALIDPHTGRPLGARYEISLAPSATTWLRWKRAKAGAPERVLFALADPTLQAASEGTSSVRGTSVLGQALLLGPLPHARGEVRAMLQRLGGEGQILLGDQATERAVKEAHLAGFRILHVAAHAIVDDEYPERSAIVLARGAPEQDGLLQFREILDLDLEGQLVVLSACRSGSGAVIGGEGVMGLSAAFFHAGARAVVASLWPIGDEDLFKLVGELGRHLGRGDSVGVALSRARRRLIREGAPAAAWAGLVVLGDADLTPFPRVERPEPRPLLGWVIVLLATGVLALAFFLRRRAHTRASQA